MASVEEGLLMLLLSRRRRQRQRRRATRSLNASRGVDGGYFSLSPASEDDEQLHRYFTTSQRALESARGRGALPVRHRSTSTSEVSVNEEDGDNQTEGRTDLALHLPTKASFAESNTPSGDVARSASDPGMRSSDVRTPKREEGDWPCCPEAQRSGEADLQRAGRSRQDSANQRNKFTPFTNYLNAFLLELPEAEAQHLVKQIQELMLTKF